MSKSSRVAIKILLGVCLIAAVYIWASGGFESIRPRGQVSIDSGHRPIMGTFGRVVATAPGADKARAGIEAAFEQLELVDNLMSDYKIDSEISRINRQAYRQPVKVSGPVFEVLQRSIEFSKRTSGAFDVTVGPLVDLWRSAGERGREPSEEELAKAQAKVGYENLILAEAEKSVRFAVEGMRLDLGGIAKGYAIDLAVEAMRRTGAVGGMVDVGGDIRCFGTPPRGKDKWAIGLQDPDRADEGIIVGPYMLVLQLSDEAVATSGNYRRFVLINDSKYSHIINPTMRAGAEELASVTIIAKNTMDADALATAVTVMGREKGLAFIESMPETEAILITPEPKRQQMQTSGANRYIK